MTLLGWTWDQWAIASGHFGAPAVVSYAAALDLRKRWQLQYSSQPGDVTLAGVERPKDHEFACALFALPPE